MLQGHDEHNHESHLDILRTADEALSVAEQAILEARAKLKVAQRNYEQRMLLPEQRPARGRTRNS